MVEVEGQGRQRPLGVVVIAIFLVVNAALALYDTFVAPIGLTGLANALRSTPLGVGAVIALAVVAVIAAIGLWRGSRRAWVSTMLLVGVSLTFGLIVYVQGEPRYGRLVIDVVIAFYLNQGAVRDFFEFRPADARAA